MERKQVEIEISRHREKPGTYVARYKSPVLGAVYSVEFPDTVTGALALHHFAEMLKTRYPADGATPLTDNESAKLVSSHEVIQGYNGIATVDDKHQIVVDAQAFGDVHEAAHVTEIIESVETTFSLIDPGKKPFESVIVTADSGFSSEEAVTAVLDAEIDAYIADPQFRKRDPGFANQQVHKAKTTDRKRTSTARKYFTAREFTFNNEGILISPGQKADEEQLSELEEQERLHRSDLQRVSGALWQLSITGPVPPEPQLIGASGDQDRSRHATQ